MRFLIENIMELPLDACTGASFKRTELCNYTRKAKSTNNIILHIYTFLVHYEMIHRQLPDYGFSRASKFKILCIIWRV